MDISGYNFPDELYFDANHYWVRPDEQAATMGLDEYTARQAGEITFVDLPRPGQAVRQGQPMGSIESGKWVGHIHAPLSGTVTQINEALEERPESINDDPYGQWLCQIKPTALHDELANLLRGEDLRRFIEAELARLEL